jgi:hypothetical protein
MHSRQCQWKSSFTSKTLGAIARCCLKRRMNRSAKQSCGCWLTKKPETRCQSCYDPTELICFKTHFPMQERLVTPHPKRLVLFGSPA